MEVVKNTNTEKTIDFNYLSFIEYARSRKKSKKAISQGYDSSIKKSKFRTEFSGVESIEEAFKLAENGWDAGIEQLELEDGILVGGNGMEVNENVHGSMVNVGNFLQGLPNNMYEFTEHREYNLEPLTIFVPLTYSAGVSVKKAMVFTKSIINLVNKYQSTNNIKIVGVFYCSFGKQKLIHKITIKDFDERFVINSIAFSFHPSFFRRLLFSVIEAEEFMDSGYGDIADQKEIWKYFTALKDGKTMLLPALGNLNTNGSFTEAQTKIIE